MTPAAESDADETGSGRRRFPVSHHLKHRRLVRSLFDRGVPDVQHTSSGSIRAVFRFVPIEDAPPVSANVQTGFFVGRRVGKAVVRNKIRRRMREAYRMMHADLLKIMSNGPEMLALGLVFRGEAGESWENMVRDVSTVLTEVKRRAKARNTLSPPPPA